VALRCEADTLSVNFTRSVLRSNLRALCGCARTGAGSRRSEAVSVFAAVRCTGFA